MTKLTVFLFSMLLISSTSFGQTILYPGDLAVVGMASNVGGDLGDCTAAGSNQFQGRDRVSFICFKTIETGTTVDITDNGWERRTPGFWGNTEGFISVTRTGLSIPKGTLITFEFPPTNTTYEAVSPDGDWVFESIGTNALNFNDGGDQLYFLQGGDWNNGTTIGCCNGNQDATYDGGRILFGFNARSDWIALGDDSQSSGLHPDINPCFNRTPTNGVSSFTSYNGPATEATQLEWIARISEPSNWSIYPDCENYQNPISEFLIGPSGMSIQCTFCQICNNIQDTLTFSLPVSGGPFSLVYTDGLDTFEINEVRDGHQIPVFVDSPLTFDLVRVTDANGCPVFSNFDGSAIFEANDLEISCSVSADNQKTAEISVIGGQGPFTLNWQGTSGLMGTEVGDGPFVLSDLSIGDYQATIADDLGCIFTCNFLIVDFDCTLSLELLSPNLHLMEPNSGEIEAIVQHQFGPVDFDWNIDEFDGQANLVDLPAGLYSLTITDLRGCSAAAEIELISIEEQGDKQLFAPNAFSPNNDGINDTFTLFVGSGIAEIRSFRIFDRWGNTVFEANNMATGEQEGWNGLLRNGQFATTGVYLFFTELIDHQGEVKVEKGTITLIR